MCQYEGSKASLVFLGKALDFSSSPFEYPKTKHSPHKPCEAALLCTGSLSLPGQRETEKKLIDLSPYYMICGWGYYLVSLCFGLNDERHLSSLNFSTLSICLDSLSVWGFCCCFCYVALVQLNAPTPQKRSWQHYFGFIFSSIISLGRGSQEAKIFANFRGSFPDENLLWFSSSIWPYLCWAPRLWKVHRDQLWIFCNQPHLRLWNNHTDLFFGPLSSNGLSVTSQ